MNILKNRTLALMIIFLAAGMALNFSGCSNGRSPVSPEKESTVSESELEFLSFGEFSGSLAKKPAKESDDKVAALDRAAEGITDVLEGVLKKVTGLVTYENGGELVLSWENPIQFLGDISVTTTFTVLPHTISEDAPLELTLGKTLMAGGVEVGFQPHGIVFSSPALLNIEVKGIDLSFVDPARLGVYYTSSESGEWELMEIEEIIVDKEAKLLRIVNAKIPHFSRYALAHGE